MTQHFDPVTLPAVVTNKEIEMNTPAMIALAMATAIAAAGGLLAASFLLAPLRPAPALIGPPLAPLQARLKDQLGQAREPFTVTRIAHASVLLDFGNATVFTNVRELAPWESATVGPLTITAAPAAHKVPEVTFVIEANGSKRHK